MSDEASAADQQDNRLSLDSFLLANARSIREARLIAANPSADRKTRIAASRLAGIFVEAQGIVGRCLAAATLDQ